jgi:ubiquinone/menaquinone biosynthesis C-methylase UbiE
VDPRLQRRVQRYGWNKAAAYYERYWAQQLRPAQDLLLGMATLQPGERVLEVACGTGLVTFRVADAIGPAGTLVATDISEDMVAAISADAAARGVAAQFLRTDAEALDFPDASFDVVICALGLMYVADPLKALQQMHRVLAPGGRACVVIWGARKHCGWAEIFPIVERRISGQVCPMFFLHGTGDALANEFTRAGFSGVTTERLAAHLHYGTGDDAIGAAFVGGPVALAYSRFDDATRESAHAEYLESIAAYRHGEAYDVLGEFVAAVGVK